MRRIFIITISILFLLPSCTWEKDGVEEIFDLLHVRRNGADMPAYIHGNVKSKVFVVVLHGGPGGTGLQYRPGVFEEVLEPSYAVVYFDQRGQGMAQGHLEPEQVTVEEMVLDVRALAKVIKEKYGEDNSLFLLGHSWGGTLGSAYLMTEDFQDEFKGWIEVDGAHDFDLLLKSQLAMFNDIAREQIGLNQSKDFWEETLGKVNVVDSFNYTDENIGELNGLSFDAEERLLEDSIIRDGTLDFLSVPVLFKSYFFSENPLTTYVSGNLTANELFNTHNLFRKQFNDFEKIRIPTLLLWGRFDFVVPPALGEQAFELIGTEEKRLVIFERSGHSPMSNEGNQFANEVISFIEEYK